MRCEIAGKSKAKLAVNVSPTNRWFVVLFMRLKEIPKNYNKLSYAECSPSNVEHAVRATAEQQPLLRARDVAALGLPTMVLTWMVAAGKLDRILRGVYILPGNSLSERRLLAQVALRVPQGIICLLSALRLHDIGTQAPLEVWVAIPHNFPAPPFDQFALHAI